MVKETGDRKREAGSWEVVTERNRSQPLPKFPVRLRTPTKSKFRNTLLVYNIVSQGWADVRKLTPSSPHDPSTLFNAQMSWTVSMKPGFLHTQEWLRTLYVSLSSIYHLHQLSGEAWDYLQDQPIVKQPVKRLEMTFIVGVGIRARTPESPRPLLAESRPLEGGPPEAGPTW